jgi:hypothetical protein
VSYTSCATPDYPVSKIVQTLRFGCYAAPCGNCLPTFRDNVSVPSSKIKSQRRKESWER